VSKLEDLKEIENWWSPSEAGRELKTTGQWVTHLARTGQLTGIRTSLGWLLDPEDVKALARERKRKKKAEQRRRTRQPHLT
jgi:hypothetical protein